MKSVEHQEIHQLDNTEPNASPLPLLHVKYFNIIYLNSNMQLSLAHAFLDYIKKLCFRRIMKALLPLDPSLKLLGGGGGHSEFAKTVLHCISTKIINYLKFSKLNDTSRIEPTLLKFDVAN